MSRPRRRAEKLDVFLMPSVIGGGRGDIEEVLLLGHALARAGFDVFLYRRPGPAEPAGFDRPYRWPPRTRRIRRLAYSPEHPALVLATWWGVTAARRGSGPLGGPGTWTAEREDIERVYGRDRTLNISVEECARTLTAREQVTERWREGGRPRAAIRSYLRTKAGRAEVAQTRRLYRRFRGFGVSNVLHLFPTFVFDRAFAREFPEAIQTGPILARHRTRRYPSQRTMRWIWYANAPGIVNPMRAVLATVVASESPVRVEIRIPRETPRVEPGSPMVPLPELPPGAWERRFNTAGVRIVAGSRSLIEALQLGRPFLYFNGLLGRSNARRRHRPEKISRLIDALPRSSANRSYLRDLEDFSRGRRIPAIVRQALTDPKWAGGFPAFGVPALGIPAAYRNPAECVVEWAREFASGQTPSSRFVRDQRKAAHDATGFRARALVH